MIRQKRVIAIALAALMLTAALAACSPGNAPDVTTPATNAPDTPDAAASGTDPVTEPPTSGEETTTQPTEVKTLKILAIGNSFSTDCMQYLYDIAKSGGVEEIVLGNLYYGGCSLAQHLGFAKSDSPSYTYYKNTSGKWESTKSYKMSAAIADEKWDYISFQQTSKTCGLVSSYGKTLTELLDIVEAKAPDAKFIWNMTWAYQQDSTHSSFPNYDRSQQKMYDMIIDCMHQCIETEPRFVLSIPCMTSIQNARTSFLGDTLTRDGYHLDYNIGRYIAGLTWYAALTGGDVDKVSYNPAPAAITSDMLAVARESVKNAIKTPIAVTESAIKTGERPGTAPVIDPGAELSPADFFEADKAVAAAAGVDLTKYTLLEWDYIENAYWNCTSSATTKTPGASAGTYHQNICSKQKYSLSDLPLGTVFIADTGWQFRIDIYSDANSKYSGTRPGMITTQYFVLTKEFMGDAQYLAWNISSSPKSDISAIYAQAAAHLRVYLPK